MRTAVMIVGVLAIAVCAGSPVHGQASPPLGRTIRDTLSDGTIVRIAGPATWNGTVMIDAYGTLGEPKDFAAVLLSRGYAVVTPAFRTGFWALPEKDASLDLVRRDVARRFGASAPVYIFGMSEGGYRVLAAMERHPADYRGGVAFCAFAPLEFELPEPNFDLLIAFDFYFPGILVDSGGTLARILPATERLGVQIDSALAADTSLASRLSRAFAITAADLPGVIVFYVGVLSEIQHGAGGNPFDIRQRAFPRTAVDPAFAREVRRFAADSAAAASTRARFQLLTGRLPVPTLIVSNSYDPILPPANLAGYADVVGRGSSSRNLVLNDVVGAGHCQMTLGEQVAAMDRLVMWAEGGARPAAGRLSGDNVAFPPFPPQPPSEIDGRWQHTGVARISMNAERGRFQVLSNGALRGTMGMVVDALASPKRVDLSDLVGERTLTIYEITGDELRFAEFTDRNRSLVERPRSFSEAGLTINVYRRIR